MWHNDHLQSDTSAGIENKNNLHRWKKAKQKQKVQLQKIRLTLANNEAAARILLLVQN